MISHFLKIGIFFLALSLLIALPSWAQGPVKIGVIDGKRCIEQTEAGKKIYSLYREKYAREQKELEAQGSALKKLQEEYSTKREVWAADVKREKEKELIRKEEDLQDKFREKGQNFQKEEGEAFQKLSAEIFETASAIGREQAFTLIMEAKSGVVYFNPAFDLTDQVIKRHNARK
jgi:outer membrane protein